MLSSTASGRSPRNVRRETASGAFLIGIAIFASASLVCAIAPSIAVLNAARCAQGIGGALATPGSLALISAGFGTAERGRAIGTWSRFAAITAAAGPLLGGWLAQHVRHKPDTARCRRG